MAYASSADVIAAYEVPIPPESVARVDNLLATASIMLDARVPSLAARVSSDFALADLAKVVVVNAVMRVLRNPSGFRTQTQTTGPFTTYVSADAGSASWFLPEELELLTPADPMPVQSVNIGIPQWRWP